MSNWQTFPERSWSPIGQSLSGFGGGVGRYGLSYALKVGRGPLLNGRISARIRMGDLSHAAGAGVICRADSLQSFVALYATTDPDAPNFFSLRLAAYKFGTAVSMATVRRPIALTDGEAHLALQFFSGEFSGELHSGNSSAAISHVLPEIPFAGLVGLVRFYGAPVFVRDIQVEEIRSKPVLPEESDEAFGTGFEYDVFLSHSGTDKALVRQVAQRLKASGLTYWLDEEQIVFGDPIVQRIEDGLQKSRYVVVALSENLSTSGWARVEYGPILHREFSGETSRRVIPLTLDGSLSSGAVPLLLSDKLRADFTDSSSFDALVAFLKGPGKVPI